MKKAGKPGLKLTDEELAVLCAEIAETRRWLLISGVIAIVIFGGLAIVGVLGFFIGLIELTNSYYPAPPVGVAAFMLAGIVGILFTAVCIWLGAAALKTAARGKDFLTHHTSTDLLLYHRKLKKVFTIIGAIALFGLFMCVIAAVMLVLLVFGFGTAIPPID